MGIISWKCWYSRRLGRVIKIQIPINSCYLVWFDNGTLWKLTLPRTHSNKGVVIAYIYVITSQQFGEGLFRACIMYGVFAAHACFHNMYTVIKNVVNLSQETDIWMNKVSHIGMLGSNVVNWSWQILYLMILTIKYANSGELVKYSPLLIFYVLVLVVFVKESWLMISHFGKQAGREVVNNIRRRSSIIADKFKASMINNKILEED